MGQDVLMPLHIQYYNTHEHPDADGQFLGTELCFLMGYSCHRKMARLAHPFIVTEFSVPILLSNASILTKVSEEKSDQLVGNTCFVLGS